MKVLLRNFREQKKMFVLFFKSLANLFKNVLFFSVLLYREFFCSVLLYRELYKKLFKCIFLWKRKKYTMEKN